MDDFGEQNVHVEQFFFPVFEVAKEKTVHRVSYSWGFLCSLFVIYIVVCSSCVLLCSRHGEADDVAVDASGS